LLFFNFFALLCNVLKERIMKKLFGLFIILIIVKCYVETRVTGIGSWQFRDSNSLFEGCLSILITAALIYGAKMGRKEPDELALKSK